MNTTPDFAILFIKMLAGLILVLILAVLLIRYILPRSGMGRWPFLKKGRRHDWVRIVDRYSLEPRKNIYLVEIAKRYFILGSGEHSLNLLGELKHDEAQKMVPSDS